MRERYLRGVRSAQSWRAYKQGCTPPWVGHVPILRSPHSGTSNAHYQGVDRFHKPSSRVVQVHRARRSDQSCCAYTQSSVHGEQSLSKKDKSGSIPEVPVRVLCTIHSIAFNLAAPTELGGNSQLVSPKGTTHGRQHRGRSPWWAACFGYK